MVIHELPLLIKEVEDKPPALETTADDTDIVGSLLAICLLEVGDCTLTLYLDTRPLSSGIMDDGKLLLLPGSIGVDIVPMHHSFPPVRVSFLEHRQAGRPASESTIRVGISDLLGDSHLGQAIDIAVSSRVGNRFIRQGIIIVVYVDIAKDKAITGRATEGQGRER